MGIGADIGAASGVVAVIDVVLFKGVGLRPVKRGVTGWGLGRT